MFCLCDLSWSNLYICRILETSFVNAHVIFQKKEKKVACDFSFSDVLTCGVAVTLYGQTCIYIYIYIYIDAYYIHYICVYICGCFTRGKLYSAVLNLSTGCFAVYAKRINSNRGHEATSVKLNPITFPCIKTPEGIILCPDRPENVARQISAIHCIGKDISHLVGSLIMLTWDGKCIPALGSTLNHLHFQQLFAYPGRKPPTPFQVHYKGCSLRTLGV